MSQVLCSHQEAVEEIKAFNKRRDQVLKELAMYYQGDITVEAEAIQYPMGWAVEANLYYSGEFVKHYELADLVLLDLNNLIFDKIRKIISADQQS